MESRMPAEAFPPGDFIREELEERGWTQADLAEIIGRDEALISGIITAKRQVTPEIAQALADAFGTSAHFWMNLETSYQLWKLNGRNIDRVRRSRIWSKAPIRDMVRRGWIEHSESAPVLEKRVLDFFEIQSLEDEPSFAHAARKSMTYAETTPAQMAWLYRAKKLAHAVTASTFSAAKFNDTVGRLRLLLRHAQEIRHVPRILAEAGIRFLIIEPLPHTRIDGVCFWLDDISPVVVISMRFDRIDYFWHTLMHELGHVKNQDGKSFIVLDVDMNEGKPSNDDRPAFEIEADRFAVETLVPQKELENFVARIHPLYSKAKLSNFAARIGVEAGIVVGQLQHRGYMSYSNNREMLTKAREIITQSALTDGWGSTLPSEFRG